MSTEHGIDQGLAWFAVAMAFVGGFVDAVGFVALAHVFTGHVTGNTVLFAIDIAEGTWRRGFHRVIAILMFLLGVGLGAILNEEILRRGIRSRFAPAFTLEAILLAGLMVGGGAFGHVATSQARPAWKLYALVSLAATALGLQNGTLKKVSGFTVHSSYITGMMTTVSEGILRWWFRGRARRDHRARRHSGPETRPQADRPRHAGLFLLVGIIVSFAVGAVIGVWLYLAYALRSFLVPFLALVAMAAIDARRPLRSWTTRTPEGPDQGSVPSRDA